MSREIKFECWNEHGKVMHDWDELVKLNKIHLLNAKNPTYKIRQHAGIKDKNGVEIYEGDLLNIFYTSKQEQWFFDGVYRVSIAPTGVKLTFVKLLWESYGYNQTPYESADVSEYGFVRSDYKNKNEDFRLCVAESNKWNYSNYFEVIGNIYENPELLKANK